MGDGHYSEVRYIVGSLRLVAISGGGCLSEASAIMGSTVLSNGVPHQYTNIDSIIEEGRRFIENLVVFFWNI